MTNNTANSNRYARLGQVTLCATLLAIGLTPTAMSDEWNKKIVVTTNVPIEIPGKALPAGTYVFKLLDSPSNRNIVQIFDKDEKHLLATALTVPNYRLEPADKPLLQFEERPSNTPEALKALFYPGDNYGQEFVYPHHRAVELAKRTGQNVLSMRDNMAQNVTTESSSANSPEIQSLQKTEVTGVNPEGEPVAVVVIVGSKPQR